MLWAIMFVINFEWIGWELHNGDALLYISNRDTFKSTINSDNFAFQKYHY